MAEKNRLNQTSLDAARFNKKYVLALLAAPSTMFPFLFGVTDLLGLWALDISSGPAAFAGIAAILGAAGIFFTRLLTGDDRVGQAVIESMEKESTREREAALDDLDRRLSADGDTRTEALLRDLRMLAKVFSTQSGWKSSINQTTTLEFLSGVEQLFRGSVSSLEKSLELWYIAEQMTTEKARKPIVLQREVIIRDVTQSIQDLGRILADIKVLDVTSTSHDNDLKRIREELDQNLAVAKNVRERMNALKDEIDPERVVE